MKKRLVTTLLFSGILGMGLYFGIQMLHEQEEAKQRKYQKWKFYLAEVHEEGYPTSQANEYFADLVYEKTDGRIDIEVIDSGKQGGEIDVIEQLQYGTLAFGRVSIAPLAEFSENLNALMLPYLYDDSAHMWRVLTSDLGEEILNSVSSAGLVGLAWYDAGARSFYLTEKISDVSELAGKKIRMQTSSLMFALGEALGYQPTAVPENEIYNAFRSKLLDGAENNIPTYESYRQYEVYPYYILDEHTRIPEMLVGSEIVLAQLKEDDRQIIKECAKEAQEYQRKLWQEREQESMTSLEKAGVEFVELTEDAKLEFKEACESIREEFGKNYASILNEIDALGTK